MVRATGWRGETIGKSTIPGNPMDVRWIGRQGNGQPGARHDIADYDMLILKELVSVNFTIQWHNTLGQAQTWFNHV